MTKVALVVELTTVDGRRDEFVALACRHAEKTLATEEGCLRYDVLVAQEIENRVLLYELYAGQAAADAHLGAAHTVAYLAASEALIAKRPLTLCHLANG